ncbi:hypothetical protein JW859_11225 [bacterium]|nr:hypothetical protein [bacterium]
MADERFCPQCNVKMDYRLGVYECPGCGHTEERVVKPAEERSPSGPGFRKEAWHQPAHLNQPSTGQVPSPNQLYSPGQAPSAQQSGYAADSGKYPTLGTEKKILFGIQAGCALLQIITVLVIGMMASVAGDLAPNLVGEILGAIIGLGVLWYVLFNAEVWMKRACIGCQGCNLIGGVFILLFAASPSILQALNISTYDHNLYIMILWIVIAPQLIWNSWIIYILWRDIEVIEGRA